MSKQDVDGATVERIQKALIQAYPHKGELQQLFFKKLDQDLSVINWDDRLNQVVFELILWASSQGKLTDLVQAVAEDRPGNQTLQALAAELVPVPQPRPETPPDTTAYLPPNIYTIGDMEFVEIPAGEFWMGSEDGWGNEKPRHKVYLDAYRISRNPVTKSQYLDFVQATGHPVLIDWAADAVIPQSMGDHPVVHVSWKDAQAYCRWLSRQTGQWITLPTEAQWEKAARGPDGFVYPWGDTFDVRRCNSKESGIGNTTAVGTYTQGASPYGVLGMSGNVWEWVQDWYAADYYAHSPERNPLGPAEGKYKVLRGGSWNFNQLHLRATNRGDNDPSIRLDDLGFRCAQEN